MVILIIFISLILKNTIVIWMYGFINVLPHPSLNKSVYMSYSVMDPGANVYNQKLALPPKDSPRARI